MNNNKNEPSLPVQQVYIAYPQLSDDKIRLNEIWQGLIEQKKVILPIFIGIFLLSGILAFTLPSKYKADVVVRSPALKDIETFNIPDIYEIESEVIYNEFLSNLRSRKLQWESFKASKIYDKFKETSTLEKEEYEFFKDNVKEKLSFNDSLLGKDNIGPVVVSLTGKDPELITEILNDLVEYSSTYTVANIKEAVLQRIGHLSDRIEEQIAGLREAAQNRRIDEIVKYTEARNIAEKLGIQENINIAGSYKQEIQNEDTIITNSTEQPLFLRGIKTLNAEIEILKNRKNDDAFIPELRKLQEELANYKIIKIKTAGVTAVNIDFPAAIPEDPYSPNRLLILIMGVLLGAVFAFFTGFALHLIKNFPLKSDKKNEIKAPYSSS